MKAKLPSVLLLLAIVFTMNSCAPEEVEEPITQAEIQNSIAYSYNPTELETMALINEYRQSLGLKELSKINYISFKSEEHNNYMIVNNVVNHDDFSSRSQNIMKVLGAKSVAENIAFNYNSPKAALEAWLKSPGHKANIEGNFTHFGLAVKQGTDGKKYYTNMFAKI